MDQHRLIFSRKKTLPILSNLLMLAALCKEEVIFNKNYQQVIQIGSDQSGDDVYIQYILVVRLLEWAYQTKDVEGTTKYILENKEIVLLHYEEMEAVQSNHCLLLFVRAYIDIGQFNEALEWHNRLIQNGIHDYSLIHTRMFSLIIHLEFGWFEMLETEVKSAQKTLKKHNKYNLFVLTFINFIKKVLKDPTKERLYLKKLNKQLVSMKSDPQHNKIFIYVNYDRWCKQRLDRISR